MYKNFFTKFDSPSSDSPQDKGVHTDKWRKVRLCGHGYIGTAGESDQEHIIYFSVNIIYEFLGYSYSFYKIYNIYIYNIYSIYSSL